MFKVKRTKKEELALLMYSMDMVKTYNEMLSDCSWFSIASGIKNNEETLKLMNEILKEGLYPIIASLRG